MDPLSEYLEGLRLRCLVWCRNELSAPWGIRFPGSLAEVPEAMRPNRQGLAMGAGGTGAGGTNGRQSRGPGAAFFTITNGGPCWVRFVDDSHEPVQFACGDLVVVFPHGKPYCVADALESPARPIWEWRPLGRAGLQHAVCGGGGGAVTALMHGIFIPENQGQHRLLAALPAVIHLRHDRDKPQPWLADTIRLLAQESRQNTAGARAVINLLAGVLVAQALRAFAARLPAGSRAGVNAYLDPEIGVVLAQIHRRPDVAWTVEAMARNAAMSRSAFAAKFTALVGDPPLHYLTTCRMVKAEHLLADRRVTIKEVASSVGYESEAAFGAAFKRYAGIAPGEFRRSGLQRARNAGVPELS